ncbi:ABC transporter permease [Rugosimonospora africana]|uniref:ABC-type transport system permease n=1 Tax=Rugosimonospora africana TaxID=556532 RepID=A0A8J3QMU2_9ACTN|nr:ABC transporter permease [Rugosimonospora africana]GIH12382.1 ABC-type transport system permease [Rugosimonospora africana]
MLKTTLAGLRAHTLRLLATALAIVLGVGFIAGTLIFNDTIKAAMYDEYARTARNVDVSITLPDSAQARAPQAGSPQAMELPLSTLDNVRRVPGVALADGRMHETLPLLNKKGKLVGNDGKPGIALSAGTVPALRPYDVTKGRVPAGVTEAALDADTAAHTGYAVGDTLTVLDTKQVRHTVTLVGIVSFGDSKQYAGEAVVILTQDAMARLAGATGYSQVVAKAAPGQDQWLLTRKVRAALPEVRAVAGAQYRDNLANDAINQLSQFTEVLLIFAIIACVVSAFVIYNTFNILIVQRMRDMALLRCVGASRGQLFGSVLLESVAVGLAGGVLGIGLGALLGYGLFRGLGAVDESLPSHAVVLTPTPIVVALLVGVVVTAASALIPAVRATRVPPLAALQVAPLATASPGRRRVLRIAAAVLVAAAGTALTVAGSRTSGDAQTATLAVVAGGLVNFLAVLIASPLFVGPLTAALGWLPGRLFGTPARLAAANARRNPGRTAATTAALMIGVGLMSAATVAITTVRTTANDQLNTHYPIDYMLRSSDPDHGSGVPTEVARRLRDRPELGTVAEIRLGQVTLDGTRLDVGSVDPSGQALLTGAAMPVVAGSTAHLGRGSIILFTSAPDAKGKKVGDTVTLSTGDGRGGRFTVAALVSGESQFGVALLAWSDFATLYPASTDDTVLVKAAPGVSPASSQAAVESVTDDYPVISVASLAEWRSEINQSVDSLIAAVAALLGIAVVIALIGIMNTLSLSVFERTRESAMIRALGLTRGQLRATLLIEALLMGVVGAIVGLSFGLLYGWATTRVMFTGFAAEVTVPVGQLLGYLAIAAVAAVAAAVLPARRAARASIVSAMAET